MVPARLGLWDVVSIIVGIIVGVGIFKTPAVVFHNVDSAGAVLAVWILGGLVSLIGALCFAELASAYPRSGGEYVYLTRAFGPHAGFYFAWAQLSVIRTANIAMLAFFLAEAVRGLGGLDEKTSLALGVAAIVILTALNSVAPEPGRQTQNLLTVIKVLCLAALVLAGLFLATRTSTLPAVVRPTAAPSLTAAMVAVLYTYMGWNEAAYVAREIRQPERNLPRALLLGTLAVLGIYLAVNAAYLIGLGFAGAQAIQAGPGDIIALAFGGQGGQVVYLLIIVMVVGSLNAMIMTGSRIFSAMGRDHAVFRPLGRWHPRWHTPCWSLVVQAVWSIALVLLVATFWRGEDGFNALLDATAAVFWLFFLLTGLSLFVLRRRDPHLERPFQVPLYPLTPILFCLWCGFMVVVAIRYAPVKSLAGLGILLAGVPVQFLSIYLGRPSTSVPAERPPAMGLQEVAVGPGEP
jgi:amino acid transporter